MRSLSVIQAIIISIAIPATIHCSLVISPCFLVGLLSKYLRHRIDHQPQVYREKEVAQQRKFLGKVYKKAEHHPLHKTDLIFWAEVGKKSDHYCISSSTSWAHWCSNHATYCDGHHQQFTELIASPIFLLVSV